MKIAATLVYFSQIVGQVGGVAPGGVAAAPAAAKGSAFQLDKVIPPGITDFSDLPRWWNNVSTFVMTKGVELLGNLLGAVAIFVIGRWIAGFLTRLVRRLAIQAAMDETLIRFVTNLVYAALLAFVCLSSLDRLGVDTTSFTAVVAAAGLAVGFALQGSLSNFAAGVLLIIFKPFKVGDLVTAGGSTGTVEEIQIFNTLMKTEANALVIVPNSSITNGTIANFSAERIRRIDLSIKCSYDDDLRSVKRFLTEVVCDDDRVLQLPPPHVAVDQLADNGVAFLVQPWVRNEYYGTVRADLLEAIKIGFEQRGFRMGGVKSVAPPVAAPVTASMPTLKAG